MRIAYCNFCCKRWFVTFNGVECTPVPVDVVVLMENQDGNFVNLHRPRVITGHCKILKSGKITVGFNIGNCHGFGNSDGYTGWLSSTRIMIEEVNPPQWNSLEEIKISLFWDSIIWKVNKLSLLN